MEKTNASQPYEKFLVSGGDNARESTNAPKSIFRKHYVVAFVLSLLLALVLTGYSIDQGWQSAFAHTSNIYTDSWSWSRWGVPLAVPSGPILKSLYSIIAPVPPSEPSQAVQANFWLSLVLFYVFLHTIIFFSFGMLIAWLTKRPWFAYLSIFALGFVAPNYWITRTRSFSVLFFIAFLWIIGGTYKLVLPRAGADSFRSDVLRFIEYRKKMVLYREKEKLFKQGKINKREVISAKAAARAAMPGRIMSILLAKKDAFKFIGWNGVEVYHVPSIVEDSEDNGIQSDNMKEYASPGVGIVQESSRQQGEEKTPEAQEERGAGESRDDENISGSSNSDENKERTNNVLTVVRPPIKAPRWLANFWIRYTLIAALLFVWANVHGGWAIIVPALVVYLFDSENHRRTAFALTFLFGAILLLGNVYYGYHTVTDFMLSQFLSRWTPYISEWRAPGKEIWTAALITLTMTGVFFVLPNVKSVPLKTRTPLLALVTLLYALLPFISARLMPYSVIWAMFAFALFRARQGEPKRIQEKTWGLTIFLVAFIVLWRIIFCNSQQAFSGFNPSRSFAFQSVWKPAAELTTAMLDDAKQHGYKKPLNIYNHYNLGSPLDFLSNDGKLFRVMIDGRTFPPYDDELLFMASYYGNPFYSYPPKQREELLSVPRPVTRKVFWNYLAEHDVHYMMISNKGDIFVSLSTYQEQMGDQYVRPIRILSGYSLWWVDTKHIAETLGQMTSSDEQVLSSINHPSSPVAEFVNRLPVSIRNFVEKLLHLYTMNPSNEAASSSLPSSGTINAITSTP